MNSNKNRTARIVAATFVLVFIVPSLFSCGTAKKAKALLEQQTKAEINLAENRVKRVDLGVTASVQEAERPKKKEDIIVQDNGHNYVLMNAVKDEETGEMVATEELGAAVITARFRNVPEREGGFMVDFNVTVPKELQDKDWQIRFRPRLITGKDTIKLDPVYITGAGYRKEQIRGYELYDKYLSRIIGDDADTMEVFMYKRLLGIYLQRNLPDFWHLKQDSTLVDKDGFESMFGVTAEMAIHHYTKWFKIAVNDHLKKNREKMYNRFVKDPIVSDGLYLDTVITTTNDDKVYRYTKRVELAHNVKKADLVLGGEVYSYGKKVYDIPDSDPLTHYIASLSAFVDTTLHYKTKVVMRDLDVNASTKIAFAIGKSDIDPMLGNNKAELDSMWVLIGRVFSMDDYVADSVLVTVCNSPDGTYAVNERISRQRTKSFLDYLNSGLDTLERNVFASIDGEGNELSYESKRGLPIHTRTVVEDWDGFEEVVKKDTVLNYAQKQAIFNTWNIQKLDSREIALRKMPNYRYVKDTLFAHLRRVDLQFSLHRKGMLKDTVHTNVLDEKYMEAVAMLKDYRYAEALSILDEYADYNTAIAYLNLYYNKRAIDLFEKCRRTPQRDYLLAIAYVRDGREVDAVTSLKRAILAEPALRFRANLDPELSEILEKYDFDEDDEYDYSY